MNQYVTGAIIKKLREEKNNKEYEILYWSRETENGKRDIEKKNPV